MLASISRPIARFDTLLSSWAITFELSVVPLDCSNLPLRCMAEIDAANPQLCRNCFRTLVGIYTAAYKQDNYAIIDKTSKQFTEQICMSVDLSFILFCESIVGCQIAIGKMPLLPDLRITDSECFADSSEVPLSWGTSRPLSAIRWMRST